MADCYVKSINISTEKGVIKKPVDSVEINELGIIGDAHAGKGGRQVSLLARESIRKQEAVAGRMFNEGDFAENITTDGLSYDQLGFLDRFSSGNLILEVTQKGKKCKKGCEIKDKTGFCIMPDEGIFCKVIHGGKLTKGDQLSYQPYVFKVIVITLSDRAYHGEYEDKSGPHAEKMISELFRIYNRKVEIEREILPDDIELLHAKFRELKNAGYDLIITTGGTGIGPRDNTPDVVKPFLDKEIYGIMELVRMKYGMDKPNALLSRSIAGVMAKSLVYVLPGSVKGVEEYLTEINKTVFHSLKMVHGIDAH
nr:molybdenum cofactor synthesis domain-containing protein [uncultured Carboxylicivirga sp.]